MCQRTDSEFQRDADSRRECVWPGHKGHAQLGERFGRRGHLGGACDLRGNGIFATRTKTKSQAHEKAGFRPKLSNPWGGVN